MAFGFLKNREILFSREEEISMEILFFREKEISMKNRFSIVFNFRTKKIWKTRRDIFMNYLKKKLFLTNYILSESNGRKVLFLAKKIIFGVLFWKTKHPPYFTSGIVEILRRESKLTNMGACDLDCKFPKMNVAAG